MRPLRNALDRLKPNFGKDGAFHKFFPVFDVIENFLYSSDRRTFGSVHVRDSSDVQRIMVVVWLAAWPAMFYGMYNIGFQALSGMQSLNISPNDDWHSIFIDIFCELDRKCKLNRFLHFYTLA